MLASLEAFIANHGVSGFAVGSNLTVCPRLARKIASAHT